MKGTGNPALDARIEPWVLSLPNQGQYAFTYAEAEGVFPNRGTGVRQALRRLVKAGALLSPKHDFYVVVPLEYRREAAPPAAWFIDALMQYVGQPYYAALLTAAELHGAAHQRPQEFQVMTTRPIRSLEYGASRRGRITWVVNALTAELPTILVNVPTGTLRVSTPETTAFDLVRYPKHAGGYDQVATVLSELGERLDAAALAYVAEIVTDTAAVQRLGYILCTVGHRNLTHGLASWFERRKGRLKTIALRRGSPTVSSDAYDSQWHVTVNGVLDPDI